MPVGPGSRVRLFDFNSAPFYNNTEGTALRMDENNERFMVRFDYDTKINAVA